MNKQKIKLAEDEAKRFLDRIKAWKATEDQYEPGFFNYGVKESGALRRASLDLTRALAEMRRPDW